jgi:hypothetical protein
MLDRFGVQLTESAGDQTGPTGVRVSWSETAGVAGRLFTATIEQTDSEDSLYYWRTQLDVGAAEMESWVQVRVGLGTLIEGLVSRPRVEPGRPGVVRRLVDHLELVRDGIPLGVVHPVTSANTAAFVQFLRRADRTLPVVAVSCGDDGSTFVDASHLADRLLGLAHVAELDRRASWGVTEELGKTLGCYRGALRIYWPRFNDGDDPYHHMAFVGGALTYLGVKGVVDRLFDVLGRAAGLSIDEPGLARALRIEARQRELEELRTEQQAHSRAQVESALEGDGVDRSTWDAFCVEYDQLTESLRLAREQLLDLELENLSLTEDRDRVRDQVNQLLVALRERQGGHTSQADEWPPPTSVREAVDQAKRESDRVVFLPEAFSSADESGYGDPMVVLELLRLLQEVATEWYQGDLASGPNLALKQRSGSYRDGISDTAVNEFGSDYLRDYNGGTITLGPHFARGTGAVNQILRLYFHFDSENKVIVVGHVGRKLRDASNRK